MKSDKVDIKIIYFLIMSVLFATLTGCVSVAEEMMTPILSEEYTYPEQPQHVWQAALDIVDSRIKGRILVKDSNNHIISWIEQLGTTTENSNKVAKDYKLDKIKFYESEITESEITEVGDGGVAITTVSIMGRNEGSLMRIRRVYYGRLTQPRMVHSRGVFANLFKEFVSQTLSKNANNKVLSR